MSISWPPTPSVEDEDAALAREHDLEPTPSPIANKEEPPLKGTVDQYPIILDVDAHLASRNDSSAIESDKENSSDESHGPPTPTAANTDQRFVLLDHATPKKAPPAPDRELPGSENYRRGRPYVAPIRTNVGSDLDEMITGRRRQLSPYASGPKKTSSTSQNPNRFSGESFLSPQHASADEYQRPRSRGPRARHDDGCSMTDPEKPSDRRRHHSRRRRESGIRTERPSLEKLAPAAFDKRSMSYTAAAPTSSIVTSELRRKPRDDPVAVDSARKSRVFNESPYSSAAEEMTRRQRHRSKSRRRSESRPRTAQTTPRESPYTSSAEESRNRTHHTYRIPAAGGKVSRQTSTTKAERPRLDISEEHYSYGAGDLPADRQEPPKRRSDPRSYPIFDDSSHLQPSSAKSPKAMEEYIAKAFKANSSRTPRASPRASPFASPSHSPPHTPRRTRNSKGYFDLDPTPVPQPSKSRQVSGDDSPWNILRPLGQAAAAAVGITTTRAAPPLSRSSTAFTETSSHGSSSKTPSTGQHSRRCSPVREEAIRPPPRASTFDVREDRPSSRAGNSGLHEQRKYPRLPTVVTESSAGTHHRPSSRSGYVGLEAPRPIIRAYSTTVEDTIRPPSASRALSSNQVLPSSATEQYRPPLAQRSASVYVTPTSANSPVQFPYPASRPVQGPPAPPPLREPGPTKLPPSPTKLPPCPRSIPVAGYHDWYTISGVSDLYICPTCMTTVGSSRFRDIFVPSFSASNKKIRCAMNEPWLRITYLQADKQRRTPQAMKELLQAILHPSETTHLCTGKQPQLRRWFQLIDPYDDTIVPGFEVCAHCARNIDLIFPHLTGTFTRPPSALLTERICNINPQNKRFTGYIEQLDKAASRFEADRSMRKPDIQDLAKYARRFANIHDCQRDGMLKNSLWHFMPNLPEFTICQDCFEDVVRPIWESPLANDIHKRARKLPLEQENRNQQLTSCQLYSARMRRVFQDAVRNNDFKGLKEAALQRHDAEARCQARHKMLMQEIQKGLDREKDIYINKQLWQRYE